MADYSLDKTSVSEDAKKLYKAMKGWGTDESTIFRVLYSKDPGKNRRIERDFKKLTDGESLESWIDDEMSGYDRKKAQHLRKYGEMRLSMKIIQACAGIGIKPVIISRGRAFMDMVRKPRFGYGKNMNPCIDCRIAMFKNAKRIMREVGGDFIATGEVIGQRPMSQRRDAMSLIDREADVKGLILRPLCAKNLEPSIAEINGLVDREKLYDYTGRSRKPQIALAKKLGITDYPTPAGGCEVTEPGFSARLRHLFEITEKDEVDDWNMLLVGRHIILGPKTKAIVSRNEKENKWKRFGELQLN